MSSAWEILGAAGIVFALVVPSRILLARAGVVDRPNARSSHQSPIVRGGGIVIALMVVAGVALEALRGRSYLWGMVGLPFLLLAAVSFWDDVKPLRPGLRLSVHALAAVIALIFIRTQAPAAVAGPNGVVWLVFAWLWIVGYTNAFNFMDGINGLAAMQAIVTGVGTALVARAMGLPGDHPAVSLSLIVAGAALGFLPHNFPRARVFLGDVGSAPLGFLLAVLAVWIAAETRLSVLGSLALLHANFVLDTAITLWRRAHRRERVWEPHREHFYQRLVRAGYSHPQVTLGEATIQVLVATAVWWAATRGAGPRLLTGASVIVVWLAWFGFAERAFRGSVEKAES